MPRLRRLLLALTGMVILLGGALVAAPARADDGDSIDSWAIDYTVRPNGTVHTQQTIVWHFGSVGDRHGVRIAVTNREPWPGDGDTQDASYPISNVKVSSPDAPAGLQLTDEPQGRDGDLLLTIGDPTQYVPGETATYVISYDIAGATRIGTDDKVLQFYWDAIGSGFPDVARATVTAAVPGGVQQVRCYVGDPGVGSKDPCTSATVVNGKAVWTQTDLLAGQTLTVAASMKKGAIARPGPILVPRGDAEQQKQDEMAAQQQAELEAQRAEQQRQHDAQMAVNWARGLRWTALSAVLSVLAAVGIWMRLGRDRRFVGLPSGVLPADGQLPPDKASGRVEVPVAFSPPQLTPAEAGYLVDATVGVPETTATLVDLAVRGALQLSRTDRGPRATLLDAQRARTEHEQAMLDRLFAGTEGEVDLSARGSMYAANWDVEHILRRRARELGWFRRFPATGLPLATLIIAGVVLLVVLMGAVTEQWYLLPIAPLVVVALVLRIRLRRGQRSGVGRALTDQVEGFRAYLATAEADQIRFEEGEDVFSRYLPWAIAFGLAERWASLCDQLVAQGRLAAYPPTWYYGPMDNWSYWVFVDSINDFGTAAMPAPAPPTSSGSGSGGGFSSGGFGGFSGGGFGGGGAFGGGDAGGGFAGGGGGGGGGSSW